MPYVETWDETKPAGTRDANLGDDDIREFKRAIRERLVGGGMNFPSTDDADAGLFKNVKFIEQSANPTSEANRAFLFTKDVSAVTELYWMDSGGTVTQLTSGGKILISSLIIASEARGDIIVRGASAWGRTAIGASGRFFRSDGTDPSWAAIADGDIASTSLPDGAVLQVISSQDAAVDSSTTALPVDNSIPQNTEGEEWTNLNVTITPKHTSNVLHFEVDLFLQHSSGLQIGIGIFQDSTAAAIFAGYINDNATFQTGHVHLSFKMDAGTTSATTFKVRYGPSSASGTVYGNADSAGTQRFNGKLYSSMKVSEVKV